MSVLSGHPAKLLRLLLVIGTVGVVAAACDRNGPSPAATSSTAATPTSSILSRGEVATLFGYNRRKPLAITRLGLNTGILPPARELGGIAVDSITYASPKGGEVPALVVIPKGKGPFPGVIVQHGLPSTKEDFLPVGLDLARTGAIAILIDAPFNRPQQGRVRGDLSLTPKDRDEQIQLIIDLHRAVDLLAARPDVDQRRLAYVGVSYGAAMGGLLAGVEDRIRAYVLAVGDGGLGSHFTATAHDLARRSLLLMQHWDDREATAIIHPDAANDEAVSEPPAARGRGPAAFKATYDWLHAAFEGLRWDVEDLVAEGSWSWPAP